MMAFVIAVDMACRVSTQPRRSQLDLRGTR